MIYMLLFFGNLCKTFKLNIQIISETRFRRGLKIETCLSLIRTGRNAGESRDEPLEHGDAFQEDLLIQILVVIVQQDWCPVHWGKADSRDTHLDSTNKPITGHRTEGME